MRAATYERYGGPEVIVLKDVQTPVPKDDEILVRVRATTVNSGDMRVRSLNVPRGFALIIRLVYGVTRPRKTILGTEAAGTVAAVGKAVTAFKPGDPVFLFDSSAMACHAEYKVIRANRAIVHKPASLTFEDAAALSFGGTTALSFLRRGNLKAGETLLVNGAAGCVGAAAVQLARDMGVRVVGVCSAGNVEFVRSLGAERVIDYAREDFAAGTELFDAVLDTVGNAPFSRSRRVLKDGGRLLAIAADLPEMLRAPIVGMTGGRKIIAGPAPERAEDLIHLAQLADSGRYRPAIGARFAFDDMREAHSLVDTGHKRGSVVVTLA